MYNAAGNARFRGLEMATIVKLKHGRFKAIIRSGHRVLKTKSFTRRTDAKQWVLRIESDREYRAEVGSAAAGFVVRHGHGWR